MRAGDTGDRFYIVDSGELEITNGAQATAHGGDFFGEIALLRDVPRTATVRAISPSELFALDRDDFLAALTPLRRSRGRRNSGSSAAGRHRYSLSSAAYSS